MKMAKNWTMPSVDKDVEQREFLYVVGGNIKGHSLFIKYKHTWQFLIKLIDTVSLTQQ